MFFQPKVVEVEEVVRRRTGMRDNGDPNFWVEAARQRDDGEKSANCWRVNDERKAGGTRR